MKLPILVACGLGAAVVAAALFLSLRGSGSGSEPPDGPEGLEGAATPLPGLEDREAYPGATPEPAVPSGSEIPATADERREPIVTGRVISYQGTPIADAAVLGYDRSGKSRRAVVADDGSFRLFGAGRHLDHIIAAASGHAARRFEDLPQGTHLVIVLEKAVAFRGSVSRTGGGGPVARARIRLVAPGRGDLVELGTETGADGRFHLPTVAPGRWDLVIDHDELAPFFESGLIIPRGGDLTRDFVLFPGLTLRGTVLRSGDDGLIEGALIEVVDRIVDGRQVKHQSRRLGPFRSDPRGRFAVPGLAPGAIQLRVRARGFQGTIVAKTLAGLTAEALQIVIRLRPGVEIRGTVLDPGGQPHREGVVLFRPIGLDDLDQAADLATSLIESDAWVDGAGQRWPAVHTDPHGRFVLRGVPEAVTLELTARDRRERFAPSPPRRLQLGKRREPLEADLHLRPGAAREGRVLDENRDAVSGAVVSLGTTRTRSDVRGQFTLDAPRSGIVESLLVLHPGFLAWSGELPASDGTLEILLDPADQVRGVVRDAEEHPIIGATVRVTDASGAAGARPRELGRVQTGFDGRFRRGGFRADLVDVAITAPGFRRALLEKLIPGPRPLEITLQRIGWEQGGDLTGIVTEAGNGQPLRNLRVTGVSSEQVHTFEGRFLLQNLEPGRHRIEVGAPGFQPHRFESVWVRAGALVELPPVALHPGYPVTLTVVGPRNLPLGAALSLTLEERDGQGNPAWALAPASRGGEHLLGPLRSGGYRLRIAAPDRTPISHDFRAGPGTGKLLVRLP